MPNRPVATRAFLSVLCLLATAPAWAQTRRPSAPNPVWEIEGHGGVIGGGTPTGGTSSLPPAGATFLTSGTPALPTRHVSSWYFGDGAVLLNQVLAAFPNGGSLGRTTALDPVLATSAVDRSLGANVGLRLGRVLTPRLTAEFGLDLSTANLRLTDAARAGIEAARAGFATGFNGLVNASPSSFSGVNISSTVADEDVADRQLLITGALRFNLATQGKYIPYVTVGGGAVNDIGDLPTVKLSGNYRFTALSTPVNESDTVNVRVKSSSAFAAVFGGGFRTLRSPKWGLRGDVRAYVMPNHHDLVLDANGGAASGTPTGSVFSNTTPAIQFSNYAALGGPQSSLSGAPITGFTVFKGSGTLVQFNASIGYFVRF